MITSCDVSEKLSKSTTLIASNKSFSTSSSVAATVNPFAMAKDQNVPNELSYQYVCDDANSQRYLYQLKMSMSKINGNKNHLDLDDQENDEHKNGLFITNAPDFHSYSTPYAPIPSSNDELTKTLNKPTLDTTFYPTSNGYSANNGGAIKRGCDDVDGENEDDSIVSSSTSISYSRRSPPKKPKFIVTYKEMREFFTLLNEESIREFLKRDSCCLISDKYALAMVFTYFKRAKFFLNEFTRINFYLALYLASDIEEDVDEYKYEIFPWALGGRWRSKFSGFLKKRDALLSRIGYRAIVSRKCCEEVMSLMPDHVAWTRERSEDHGGATRAYLISKSRKHLSSRTNIEEEELNLPRGPSENPKPCPLCLVNQGPYRKVVTPINQFKPTIIRGYSKYESDINNNSKVSSFPAGYVKDEERITKMKEITNQIVNHNAKTTEHEERMADQVAKPVKTPRKILKQENVADRQHKSDEKVESNAGQLKENEFSNLSASTKFPNGDLAVAAPCTSTSDVNNNNVCSSVNNNNKNLSKINNLVLSETSFIFKNTLHQYQHLLCDDNGQNDEAKKSSTSSKESTSSDTRQIFNSIETNLTDDDDDDEDEEDTNRTNNYDDDVFSDVTNAKPVKHQSLKKKHDSNGNGRFNQSNLGGRNISAAKKWLTSSTNNNVATNLSTRKGKNFSLSAGSSRTVSKASLTLNNKDKVKISNFDSLSTSFPKPKNILLNDQLVPREILQNQQ